MKHLTGIGRAPIPDVISVLEAIYQVEQSREQWLSGVLSAAFSALNAWCCTTRRRMICAWMASTVWVLVVHG
jgi:hypothetical protein